MKRYTITCETRRLPRDQRYPLVAWKGLAILPSGAQVVMQRAIDYGHLMQLVVDSPEPPSPRWACVTVSEAGALA